MFTRYDGCEAIQMMDLKDCYWKEIIGDDYIWLHLISR